MQALVNSLWLLFNCWLINGKSFELINGSTPNSHQYGYGISNDSLLYFISSEPKDIVHIDIHNLFNGISSSWQSVPRSKSPLTSLLVDWLGHSCDLQTINTTLTHFWITSYQHSYTYLNNIFYAVPNDYMMYVENKGGSDICTIPYEPRKYNNRESNLQLFQYDMSSKSYIDIVLYSSKIPSSNFVSCLLSYDIYIFVIGSKDTNHTDPSRKRSTFEIYDTVDNLWMVGALLNHRRGRSGCSIYNESIYVFSDNMYVGSRETWDGTVESHPISIGLKDSNWSVIHSSYGIFTQQSCITVYDFIYCIGGRTRSAFDDPLDTIRIFDCRTNKLISSPNIKLNYPRLSPGLTTYHFDDNLDNEISIVVYGGYQNNYVDWTTSSITSIERLIVTKPTLSPTAYPTSYHPTYNPTLHPSMDPTSNPTLNPSSRPTYYPTNYPTNYPTLHPTWNPTLHPTSGPSTKYKTKNPSVSPSITNNINVTVSNVMITTMDNGAKMNWFKSVTIVLSLSIFCYV